MGNRCIEKDFVDGGSVPKPMKITNKNFMRLEYEDWRSQQC